MDNNILFETTAAKQGSIGIITLNRPSALNALTHEMISAMKTQLSQWAEAPDITAVWVRGEGARAFCAGGDIKQLYLRKEAGTPNLSAFFNDEYQLNQLIHHYPKPYLAFLHGITMGGGAGISVNGRYRVMTETCRFAMPETGIGFFPDVGGSYFLSRTPGQCGRYLGLTGARIDAADCYYAGIATHLVPEAALAELQTDLLNQSRSIDDLLAAYHRPVASKLATLQPLINTLFAPDSVHGIFQACEKSDEPFAKEVLTQLQSKSPTSLAVTLEQLKRGKQLNFDRCMQMEFRLASQFLQDHDFFEGIRAVVIDKDNQPRWQSQPVNIAPYFTQAEGSS